MHLLRIMIDIFSFTALINSFSKKKCEIWVSIKNHHIIGFNKN